MLIVCAETERETPAPVRAIDVSLVLSPLSPVASDCPGLFSFYYLCVCTWSLCNSNDCTQGLLCWLWAQSWTSRELQPDCTVSFVYVRTLTVLFFIIFQAEGTKLPHEFLPILNSGRLNQPKQQQLPVQLLWMSALKLVWLMCSYDVFPSLWSFC